MHSLRSSGSLGTILLVSALGLGCSALINPDATQLGDPDDGGLVDGATPDGGQNDADIPDARRDAGRLVDSGPFDAGLGEDGASPDAGPGCSLGCDDGIACTEDDCLGDTCAHSPDSALCGAGLRCSASMGCVSEGCTMDAECDDGLACTNDRCAGGSCTTEPVNARCDDGIDCTADACTPGAGADARGCVPTANDALCDDFCNPGATCEPRLGCAGGTPRDCLDGDVCTMDACDPVAGACVSEPRDDDADGAPADSVGGMMCAGGTDCDDGDATIGPGVAELCDGFDNNCNGSIDEGCDPLPDTCATAEEIVLDGGRRGRVSGRFGSLGDEYVTGALCGGSMGRDAVYYVDLPGGTWDMTVDTIGSVADTVLGLGTDCSVDGLALICNDDMDPGRVEASRIFTHRVQASGGGLRFYILVEGYSAGERGDYVVNVFLESAHSDSCGASGGRPLDITGGGTVLGFQPGFTGTSRGSCMPVTDFDEESVLTFESSSATPTLAVYSSDFVPDLFVRAGCAAGSEVACDVGSALGGGVNAASVSPRVTPATPHVVYVDGRGSYVLVYSP